MRSPHGDSPFPHKLLFGYRALSGKVKIASCEQVHWAFKLTDPIVTAGGGGAAQSSGAPLMHGGAAAEEHRHRMV